MPHGPTFSAIAGGAVAFGIALSPASVLAQSADWRALRIDGSTPESFQASVASLQNALSASARDDFEAALAAIWIGNVTTGDIDKDGSFELGDVSELRQYSEELLADIHRGDLVVAIEDLDVSGDEYSTADYFAQLDGLGYEAVLDLAGLTDESPEESQALRAYKAQLLCRNIEELKHGGVRAKWCDKFFGKPLPPCRPAHLPACRKANAATPAPPDTVAATLSRAREALNAGDTDTAEAAIDSLSLDRLTPYERGFAEMLLFNIKYRQRLYAEAREHLQPAVDVGIMSGADADAIVAVIDHIERTAARPPGQPVLADPAGAEEESASSDSSADALRASTAPSCTGATVR
jgi:hypothetical protein